MAFSSIPNSLALIPDGNRRWALSHKLSILSGYSLGVKKFIEFSDWCYSYGIRNLTVWALSSENIKRSPNEVRTLFNIYRKAAKDKEIIAKLEERQTRLNVISNRKLLPRDLNELLCSIEKRTENNRNGVINLLLGYGGKDDILFAAKKAVGMVKKGYRITAEAFRQSLLSYQVPEIDYIIRTSGEKRLSGFMPWQTSYSELYFSDKLWPEFTKADLRIALAEYGKRSRRFGR